MPAKDAHLSHAMCHADMLWALCRQVLQAGSATEAGLTEKGLLQLLMDVRFLKEALAGGRPAQRGTPDAPTDDSAKSAVVQRMQDFAQLETELQVCNLICLHLPRAFW